MEKWSIRNEIWKSMCESLNIGNDIYIWGASGTGKTSLAKDALSYVSLPFTYINCIEFFTIKSLFRKIREGYLEFLGIDNNKFQDLHKFSLSLKGVEKSSEIYYIVLDKAHKLIKLDVLLINRLIEVSRISECNLKYIIITDSYVEEIFVHPDTIDRDFTPAKIFINEYNSNQLSKVLRNEFPYGSDQNFIEFFDCVCQLLKPYTNKIFHYRSAFNNNKAYEIFLKLPNSVNDKIFIIAREIGNIEVSLFQKFKLQKEYQHNLSAEAKILIISGFICSTNPPRLDSILLKGAKKTEKRRIRKEFDCPVVPEKFSLQRLQGVYSIILHLYRNCNARDILNTPIETPSFCALVNTLTQKKIFSIVTKKDPLGYEKLMCSAQYDFCAGLARSLDLKLDEFVIDIN